MTSGRTFEIKPLARGDLPVAVRLHLSVLDTEFLSTCGERVLRAYYRAWMESPTGIALCASDNSGRPVGVLLGSTEPASHYPSMLRTGGLQIASGLVLHALAHPAFGRDLIRTRLRRYLRGVLRAVTARARARRSVADRGVISAKPALATELIGEVTHLLVEPSWQGEGIGRRLIEEAAGRARQAGVDSLVLVTPPDSPACAFYERLGWEREGDVVSRSKEPFVRFRLRL